MRHQADNCFDPEIRVLVCARVRLPNWEHDNLRAPYWRFYWNPRPGAWVRLQAKRVDLDPDTCVVIPPYTPFGAHTHGESEQFYIHFLAGASYEGVEHDLFAFALSTELRTVLESASAALAADPRPRRGRLGVLLHYIVACALSRVPEDRLGSGCHDERVLLAIRRMEQDLSRPPANAVLAREAHMNTNAFIRLFREQTRETPQAFLRRRRIEQACLMLHHGEASIDEIAQATGFCDRYHFSRVFKRLMRQSPAAFRRARG